MLRYAILVVRAYEMVYNFGIISRLKVEVEVSLFVSCIWEGLLVFFCWSEWIL